MENLLALEVVSPRTGERALPFVLCTARRQLFAVSCAHVREILTLPRVETLAGLPAHVRGVVNIRGHVMQVVDLRVRLGMPSARDEVDAFVRLLTDREEDHRRWLDELLASVEERRPFTLATDPHKCAFGRWYDTFETDDRILALQLRKFADPHRRIHEVAVAVGDLMADGKADEAKKLVELTRTGVLSELIEIFEATRQLVREQHRDIGVVLQLGDQTLAMGVDTIESIEFLEAHERGTAVLGTFAEDVRGVAMRKGSTEPVLLLDPGHLFG